MLSLEPMFDKDLLLSSYNFDLPETFIALRPTQDRALAKLMIFDKKSGELIHSNFAEIGQYLPAKSHLVFNQSKVYPCRLKGVKESGGVFEIFFLSPFLDQSAEVLCLIKASGKRKIGEVFHLLEMNVEIREFSENGSFKVRVKLANDQSLHQYLQSHGQIPIPPYIRKGVSDEQDKLDYQTIFAKQAGSVAAPTAGLHFTEQLLEKLKDLGFSYSFVTLHVGLGTFQPVKTETITDHQMHREFYFVDRQTNAHLAQHKDHLIAVGTTSLRVLETMMKNKQLGLDQSVEGWTNIFLHPGKKVESIKGLVTNFHLPQSSLLMLVSCLVGREEILRLYEDAKRHDYRFFSYGDGQLLLL